MIFWIVAEGDRQLCWAAGDKGCFGLLYLLGAIGHRCLTLLSTWWLMDLLRFDLPPNSLSDILVHEFLVITHESQTKGLSCSTHVNYLRRR